MTEISGLETSAKCDGCKDEINLLKTHLVVTSKPQKNSFVMATVEHRTDDDSVEEDVEQPVTLGTRSGVGLQLRFHNNECAAKYFDGKKSRAIKLTLNRDDEDPYAEGAEIMHGSDQTEGSDDE